MKQHYFFLAITLVATSFSACKKEASTQSISNVPTKSAISIPISHGASIGLDSLLSKGEFKNPDEFLAKARSLQAERPVISTSTDMSGMATPMGATSGTDEFNIAYSWHSPSTLISDDYTGTRSYYGTIQSTQRYPTRNIYIQVLIPFQYNSYNGNQGGEAKPIYNLRAYTPIQLLPVGAHWGVVTQLFNYFNAGPSTDFLYQSQPFAANAKAQELRTQIVTDQRTLEFSADLNLADFKIGAKLSDGRTIVSVSNLYNQHTMNASGTVTIDMRQSFGSTSVATWYGTIDCQDLGILQN